MERINGKTEVFVILGQPIGHTLSPALHNAAFAALNYNGVYLACPVPEDRLSEAVQGIRALGIRGGNVTIPYKERIIPYLDGITDKARLIGAVNTLYWEEDRLMGANTDSAGFLQALQQEEPAVANYPGAVIIGAGGAAKAVAVSLASAGLSKICLVNRNRAKAEDLGRILSGLGCMVHILDWSAPNLEVALREMPLIINATPLGMSPAYPDLEHLPYQVLGEGHFVVDLIYRPKETFFLQKAKAQGCRTMNGSGMLLEQGVLSFGLWTGQEAPREVMAQVLARWL